MAAIESMSARNIEMVLCICIFCNFFVTPCDATQVAAGGPLALTVTSSCGELRKCSLHLTLTNRSSEPVKVYEASLPWAWYGMLLIAAENRPGAEALSMFRPTDDPDSEVVTLVPGGSREGDIDLSARYSSFSSVLARSDIVLFWSYEALAPGRKSCFVSRGSLVIRQTP